MIKHLKKMPNNLVEFIHISQWAEALEIFFQSFMTSRVMIVWPPHFCATSRAYFSTVINTYTQKNNPSSWGVEVTHVHNTFQRNPPNRISFLRSHLKKHSQTVCSGREGFLLWWLLFYCLQGGLFHLVVSSDHLFCFPSSGCCGQSINQAPWKRKPLTRNHEGRLSVTPKTYGQKYSLSLFFIEIQTFAFELGVEQNYF